MADHDDIGDLEGDIDADDMESWMIFDELSHTESNSDVLKPGRVKKDLKRSNAKLSTAKSDVTQTGETSNLGDQATMSDSSICSSTPKISASIQKTLIAKDKVTSTTKTSRAKNIIKPDKRIADVGEIAGIFDSIASQIDIINNVSPSDGHKSSPNTTSEKVAMKASQSVNKSTEKLSTILKTTNKAESHKSGEKQKEKNVKEQEKQKEKNVKEQDRAPVSKKESKSSNQLAKQPASSAENKTTRAQQSTENQKDEGMVSMDYESDSKQRKDDHEAVELTQQESQWIDTRLAEQMFRGIINCPAPRSGAGEKYVVSISPVEIADLAQPSTQALIETFPNISFFFKKAAANKFKKKKGSAQIILYKNAAIRDLFQMLIPLDLNEKDISIQISGSFTRWPSFNATFKLNLKLAQKLLKFDLNEGKLDRLHAHFIELAGVPCEANYKSLKILFPFSNMVRLKGRETKEEDGTKHKFHKSAKVYYSKLNCLNTLLECCSEFTFNDHPLTPGPVRTEDLTIEKNADDESKDSAPTREKEAMEESYSLEHTMKSVGEGREESVEDTEEDVGVANMTRDVCSTMMDSLNRLKQLDTDDPNVQKILEMQAELLKLQESLTKKNTEESKQDSMDTSSSIIELSDSSGRDIDSSTEDSAKKQQRDPEIVNVEVNQSPLEMLQKMKEAQRKEFERRKAVWTKQLTEGSRAGLDEGEGDMETNQGMEMEEENVETRAAEILEEERKKLETQQLEGKRRQEEQERRKKEQELKAQQKLREELERAESAEAARKQSSSSPGAWDPKAILQSVQESFKSLSKTLPRASVSDLSHDDQTTEDTLHQRLARKRDSVDAHLDDESKESQKTKVKTEPPVTVSEQEYRTQYGTLTPDWRPKNVSAHIVYTKGRKCPVDLCPTSSKSFITDSSFSEHWTTFHMPTTTLMFCTQCTAYFSQRTDLENHLGKLHGLTDSTVLHRMVGEARVKVVANPSYQNPWPYTMM